MNLSALISIVFPRKMACMKFSLLLVLLLGIAQYGDAGRETFEKQ